MRLLRRLWFGLVILLAGGSLLNACMSVGSAQSAMQASQLYDEVSMVCLVLIAITLAAWYARPTAEENNERLESTESKPET